MTIVTAATLLVHGWPEKSLASAYASGQWGMLQCSILLGVVLCIIGMVKSSSKRMPPGSIGTENPADVPADYRSVQYDGGSYLIAGALVLLVGTSMCWSGVWL